MTISKQFLRVNRESGVVLYCRRCGVVRLIQLLKTDYGGMLYIALLLWNVLCLSNKVIGEWIICVNCSSESANDTYAHLSISHRWFRVSENLFLCVDYQHYEHLFVVWSIWADAQVDLMFRRFFGHKSNIFIKIGLEMLGMEQILLSWSWKTH